MKDKIYIQIGGRCGNQFFQYAFARALQLTQYPNREIVISFDQVYKSGKREEGWIDSLKEFSCDYREIKKKPYRYMTIDQLFSIAMLVLNKKNIPKNNYDLNEKLAQKGLFIHRTNYYIPPTTNWRHLLYIRGRFEAHEYFDSIRDQLIKDFSPKKEVLDKNKWLLQTIMDTESVCITIRRGDFLDVKNSMMNVCDSSYYKAAMIRIKQLKPDCKFFVFSDNIQEARRMLEFPEGTIFESGNDPVYEKLRLMYSCKHFIISNSTFSWWAQYLGRNPDKIVLVPKKWRLNNENCEGMYLPNMIKI